MGWRTWHGCRGAAIFGGATFTMVACSGTGSGPAAGRVPSEILTGGVRLSVTTTILPSPDSTIPQTLVVENPSGESVDVAVSRFCPVLLRLYEDASRQGEPVWDLAGTGDCPAALLTLTLAPGDIETLEVRTPVSDVLGDSLTARRYFFTGVARVASSEFEIEAGDGFVRP